MVVSENTLFWDWNGTLLDDTQTCVDTMNEMLKRRGMPVLNLELYKEVFGFPVYDYYRKLGFDYSRESFEDLSAEFIDAYNIALRSAPLAADARKVLEYFRLAGKRNTIISAMRQDMLLKSVMEKGIEGYFTEILGISNIYAAGKSEMAREYVKSRKLDTSEIVFIGDTEHDFEVALELGCRCILIADGHQSEERLLATGAEVLPSLGTLINGLVSAEK